MTGLRLCSPSNPSYAGFRGALAILSIAALLVGETAIAGDGPAEAADRGEAIPGREPFVRSCRVGYEDTIFPE